MGNHKMRRQDRAMTEAESRRLLHEEKVGRLAMADVDGQPYVVPLNHVLLDDTIYFHCALSGRKLEILQRNPRVCYEVDRLLGIQSAAIACNYGAFYMSALAFGTAFLVENANEKAHVLNQLTARYSPEDASFMPVTAEAAARVSVVGIKIDKISGKARPIG